VTVLDVLNSRWSSGVPWGSVLVQACTRIPGFEFRVVWGVRSRLVGLLYACNKCGGVMDGAC